MIFGTSFSEQSVRFPGFALCRVLRVTLLGGWFVGTHPVCFLSVSSEACLVHPQEVPANAEAASGLTCNEALYPSPWCVLSTLYDVLLPLPYNANVVQGVPGARSTSKPQPQTAQHPAYFCFSVTAQPCCERESLIPRVPSLHGEGRCG